MGTVRMALAVAGMAENDSENSKGTKTRISFPLHLKPELD
jgi:hypothetical protein